MIKKIIKIYFTINILAVLFCGALIYPLVSDYFEFKEVANAAIFMPYYFGGQITYYQKNCQSDPVTGVCANCPKCTVSGIGVGPYACGFYQEIWYEPPGETHPWITNVCVPPGFIYIGNSMPEIGKSIMGGGASNIMPWIIGIGK